MVPRYKSFRVHIIVKKVISVIWRRIMVRDPVISGLMIYQSLNKVPPSALWVIAYLVARCETLVIAFQPGTNFLLKRRQKSIWKTSSDSIKLDPHRKLVVSNIVYWLHFIITYWASTKTYITKETIIFINAVLRDVIISMMKNNFFSLLILSKNADKLFTKTHNCRRCRTPKMAQRRELLTNFMLS